MTRPLFEPTTQRALSSQGWGQAQLFRRPARTTPGTAIYEIKVFPDDIALATGDDKFVWEIPEDLDQAAVVKVEAYISTAGSSDSTIQIRASDPCDTGADILSTPITIDTGDCNSKDAAVQPVVIDPTVVSWGDHLHIDVDAAGLDALGLGVIVTLAPAALAAVVLQGAQGAQGPPGGIVNWLGEWSGATTYNINDAVSHLGSSYVSLTTNTNVEPGVDAGWETDWMLLAAGATGTPGAELAYGSYTVEVMITATAEASATTVATAGSFTADGTESIYVEFMAPGFAGAVSGDICTVYLYQDGSSIGSMIEARVLASSFGQSYGFFAKSDTFTPASGSRTYSVRATRSNGSNAMSVYGGAGGSSTRRPGYVRVIRAS